MSTPDDGAPVPQRRPVGERRARRGEDGATGAEDAPLTRREMKARGMVFTTELPVIPAPLLAEGGEAEGGAPVPARPTVRERPPETGGSASSGTEPDEPSERTTTGRRPVVRPPSAARAIRRLDETGAISAVQPVVAAPVGADAAADPLTDPGPTNVAASWESAVSMPAVVLGIRDRAEAPTVAGPLPVPGTELVAPPIRPPRRESLRDQAGRGLPGTTGRQGPPEASPGWSALLEEEATSTGTMLARIAASLAEETSAAEAVSADRREGPAADGQADAGRREVPEAHGDVDGRAAGDVVVEAPRPPRTSVPEAARVRRWWPESGALRFALLVAVGVALGLLIVLLANGTLGSVFAAGPGHVPAPPVPGAPPAALLAPTIV